MRLTAGDTAALLGIGVLWGSMAWMARPAGEFPLADDWSYASSVLDLVRHRGLTLHPFTPTIAFSHILLGAAVSSVFGFSFEALRIAMYLVGLMGIWATYGLVRLLVPSVPLALTAALTVATSPIYFLLAGTFMTDVSFYAMSMGALCGLTVALRTDSRRAFFLGTVASCAALLNRQIGLAIPLGFALADGLLHRPLRLRRALTPLVLGIGLLLLWQLLVPLAGGPSLLANSKLVEAAGFLSGSLGEIVARVTTNALVWVVYAGLLCLPFVVVVRSSAAVTGIRIAATTGVLVVLWVILVGRMMPALPPVGSWLTPHGVGPMTLRDAMILHQEVAPELPWVVRCSLTAASLWSAAWLLNLAGASLARLVAAPSDPDGRVVAMLGIVGALWVAPSLASFFFDRYLLPFVGVTLAAVSPLLAGGVIQRIQRCPRAMRQGAAVLVLQAIVSVAAAHDYFAWNRARLEALEWLLHEKQVDIGQVDAGFEWSGWYLFDANYQPVADKSWWWVRDDTWVLSFGVMPGYREVQRVSYRSWFAPFAQRSVLVLSRATPAGPREIVE